MYPYDSMISHRASYLINGRCSSHSNNHPKTAAHLLTSLDQQYNEIHGHKQDRMSVLSTTQHPSEITPWLSSTGIHLYLKELHIDLEELYGSYCLPKKHEEPFLHIMCDGIKWILSRAMQALIHDNKSHVRLIGRHNALVLNSFKRGDLSLDPIWAL